MPTFRALIVTVLFLSFLLFAQTRNPVPFVNQPLVPSSVSPGPPDLVLTVNGTEFVPTSAVRWNAVALSTKFVSSKALIAIVPASYVRSARTASITVHNPAPGGGNSLAVPFTVTNPTTSVHFASSTTSVGTTPISVVVADFNHDGKTDMAVVNSADFDPDCGHFFSGSVGTISILLGNGDGTFSVAPKLCFPDNQGVVPQPNLTVLDLNGDGKLDLIAQWFENSGGYNYVVYFGNGDGTFTEGPVEPSGSGSTGNIVAADFDGDGRMDYALAQQGSPGNVSIYLGNGRTTGFLWAGGSYLAAGDFNNDGILDLLLGGSIAFGNGDGTFAPPVSLNLPSPAGAQNIVADFDGDGNLDLVVPDSTTLWVFRGHGDGTFTQVSGEPTLLRPAGDARVADLNGDGKLDLVFSDAQVLLGNGDGTFQPAKAVEGTSLGAAVGDFNRDGRLDLAVVHSADNTVSVLLQTPLHASVALGSGLNPSSVNQSVTFTAVVSGPVPPTGSVRFKNGKSTLGTVPLANEQASFTTAFTKVGAFSISASYSGDHNYSPMHSKIVRQVVEK
jgi:hypothetical protein